MKTAGRLPCPVADATHKFVLRTGWSQGYSPPVASHDISFANQTTYFDLEPLHGRVDIARGTTGARFLPEYIPWLNCSAQFQPHSVVTRRANHRETKFLMRREPFGLQIESRAL